MQVGLKELPLHFFLPDRNHTFPNLRVTNFLQLLRIRHFLLLKISQAPHLPPLIHPIPNPLTTLIIRHSHKILLTMILTLTLNLKRRIASRIKLDLLLTAFIRTYICDTDIGDG